MKKMPSYTEIPTEFKEGYVKKFLDIDLNNVAKLSEEDPVIFGYYYLGKKVRLHQAYLMAKFVEGMKSGRLRLAACMARQLGKTIACGILIVWLCWYNKWAVTIANLTIIYVVSRDDETAVELLEKVRFMLYEGDRNMNKYFDGKFFTGSLREPNNTHQITFLNGCFIKSIPPTKKALGKSASLLFIDEAHRLNCLDLDSDTFFDYASAMVAETGGGIVLSSSPEGVIGFFHRAIDPDSTNPRNEYDKMWFPHSAWDDGSIECLRYQSFVESEKQRLSMAGRYKFWQQEYEALFTVTETSFFELKDIEDAIKDTPQMYEWKDTPCSLGIDYGLKTSRTVLTIRSVIKDEIIQLFQYRCPADFDINHLTDLDWEHSIHKLKGRYNLMIIVVDDSAPGDTINRWLESNAQIQVKKYNFRSDQMSKTDGINRNCAAYSYRAKLKEGILKIPRWNDIQQYEMKILQEKEQKVLISIKAPEGHLCDTFDSDMMACIPFLDMQGNIDFSVDLLEMVEEPIRHGNRFEEFHSPTDEECKEMIRLANQKLL